MRRVWLPYLRRGLFAIVLVMTCTGVAQDLPPPPISTIDLQVSMESGDYLAPEYLSVPVYVRVTNLGPDTAEEVRVAIELPPFVPGQPLDGEHACDTSGSAIQCSLAPLGAGASAVVTVQLFLPPEPVGKFELSATTTGQGTELVPENNQAMLSTSGPGRLRLAGGGCSSGTGSSTAMGGLGLLLLLLRPGRRRSGTDWWPVQLPIRVGVYDAEPFAGVQGAGRSMRQVPAAGGRARSRYG